MIDELLETGDSSSSESVEPESLVQRVVDGVISGVESGSYQPGQRLVAAEVAATFGVSRAPVREAFQILAGLGIVDLARHRGARIRALTVAQLVDFLEFTEAVCLLGVRRAAPQMRSLRHRAALDVAFNRLHDAWQTREAVTFIAALFEFHGLLNRVSGNHFVEFFYSRRHFAFYNRLLAFHIPGAHWDEYLANYRRVYRALLSADAHAATVTFSAHMQWVISILWEADSVPLPDTAPWYPESSAPSR